MVTAEAEAGLLSGIRVVDLSSSWVGAHMGLFFADQGAEVVCVEPPGGSALRHSAAWAFLGRGKHSMVADLAQPEGVEQGPRLGPGSRCGSANLAAGAPRRGWASAMATLPPPIPGWCTRR